MSFFYFAFKVLQECPFQLYSRKAFNRNKKAKAPNPLPPPNGFGFTSPPSIRESSVRFKLFSMFNNATKKMFTLLNGSVLVISTHLKRKPIRSKAMKLHIVHYKQRQQRDWRKNYSNAHGSFSFLASNTNSQLHLSLFCVLAYTIKKTKNIFLIKKIKSQRNIKSLGRKDKI